MAIKRYWHNATDLRGIRYSCGYCNSLVAPSKGFSAELSEGGQKISYMDYACICPNCEKISYLEFGKHVTPSTVYGKPIEELPDDVKFIYEEARNCFSTKSFSSVAFCCRKILMHIAVEKGDAPGKRFVEYIEYLDTNGYIPRDCKPWVDKIRTVGNDVNHQIVLTSEQDASLIMEFTTLLLKIVYEFKKKAP